MSYVRADGAAGHWRLALTLVTSAAALVFALYIARSGKLFWDFDVYRAAIAAFRAHANPYDVGYMAETYHVNPYIYPPLVLLLSVRLSWLFETYGGESLLLLLHTTAFALIPWLLTPQHLRRSEMMWMWCVSLVACGFAGTKLFLTGNVAALASAVLLLALHRSVPHRSYVSFWATLFVVSQLKISFICLAVVPVLLDGKLLEAAGVGVLIAASYAANYALSPDLFHSYSAVVASFSNDPGRGGLSFMSAVEAALTHNPAASSLPTALLARAAHSIFAAGLLGFGALVAWRTARAAITETKVLWALTGAFLISPRLLPYETALLIIPFLVFVRQLAFVGGVGLYVTIAALVGAAMLATTPLADWGALVALAGAWTGMGVRWLESGVSTEDEGLLRMRTRADGLLESQVEQSAG